MRAVSKQERVEEVTAPQLLLYNAQRGNLSVTNQFSYIKDFEVEIAQAAAVADPVVGVVKDGVVLDVRPVVSADRKFITIELRPTLATLAQPIPTFTTTLGVGQPISIQLPRLTVQKVRTTVTIPDGGTLMLGGMKSSEKQNLNSGVPFLRDIPVVSFLFTRKGSYIANRKVLILLRANILIPTELEPRIVTPDEIPLTSAR
jgi:type II secretory pathway component GspD/PulD (secretin)